MNLKNIREKVSLKPILFSLGVTALVCGSCTDLDEGVYDQFVAEDFYQTDVGTAAALADVYKEMRGDWGGIGIAGADRGWYDLNETCTDEMMIPTRSDGAWADNGIWQQMYLHTWTSGQAFMQNTWDWLYRAIIKTNQSIELLESVNANEAAIAEAKVLRAYFYSLLLDGWGNVPIVTSTSVAVEDVVQSSRTEVFDFVESELVSNVDKLATTKGDSYYNRFNVWAGYAALAKLYLNAEVYTGTPMWDEANDALDKIIDEGGFSLVSASQYLSTGTDGLFGDKCNTQEVILALFVDGIDAPRNIIGIRSLNGVHGQALLGLTTWNGATAHKDFIDKYADEDIRKAQWLVGPQMVNGEEVVNYDPNISSITSAGLTQGARNAKFLPVAPYNGGTSSNDFPVFRYADILLMKAEALVRSGNAGAAATYLNMVRNRAGLTDWVGDVTLEELYDERGRELAWEGYRRQDMIRFGKFLEGHDFKSTSEEKYLLFPIPSATLVSNPSLEQNPGY